MLTRKTRETIHEVVRLFANTSRACRRCNRVEVTEALQNQSQLSPALRQRSVQGHNVWPKKKDKKGTDIKNVNQGMQAGERTLSMELWKGKDFRCFGSNKSLDLQKLYCREFGQIEYRTHIISRTPINVDQAHMAFLSALEANNLALVPAGNFKGRGTKERGKDALPFYEDPSKVPIPMPKSLLYQLKYTSKDAVQSLLKSLMSKTAIFKRLVMISSSLTMVPIFTAY